MPALEVIGTVLGGKYRPLRMLAQGGMGAVYEAEHVEIGNRVAVKIMKRELAERAEAVARFRREAQIAGNLGHDNICGVLDMGTTDDGAPYLVMPLLRGVSLARELAESGPMSEERALDIVTQILSALAAAHAAGVVHRDLKPDNIFLTQVGDRRDFVKVLDFGISKVIGAQRETAALTQTGTLVGTPYYMAPEQARGLKDQDVRVDVYAVGVMLYEMLTGHLPFTGDEIGGVIIKIATEGFLRPRQIRKDLTAAIESLVLKAMERERERRFPDSGSMRASALSLLDGSGHAAPLPPPASTTPATAAPVTPPPARMATDLGQTTPFGWSSQSIARPSGRRRGWLVAIAAILALAGGGLLYVALERPDDAPVPATADRVEPLVPPAPALAAPGSSAPPSEVAAPVTPDVPARIEPAQASPPAPAKVAVPAVAPSVAAPPEVVTPAVATPRGTGRGARRTKRVVRGDGIAGPAGTTFTTENE